MIKKTILFLLLVFTINCFCQSPTEVYIKRYDRNRGGFIFIVVDENCNQREIDCTLNQAFQFVFDPFGNLYGVTGGTRWVNMVKESYLQVHKYDLVNCTHDLIYEEILPSYVRINDHVAPYIFTSILPVFSNYLGEIYIPLYYGFSIGNAVDQILVIENIYDKDNYKLKYLDQQIKEQPGDINLIGDDLFSVLIPYDEDNFIQQTDQNFNEINRWYPEKFIINFVQNQTCGNEVLTFGYDLPHEQFRQDRADGTFIGHAIHLFKYNLENNEIVDKCPLLN